jgi:uncharacterized protein with GYD domain
MPRYMHQFGYSLESMKAMAAKPQDRRAAAKKLVAAAGGKLIDIYFCFGDYDGVLISEFPSNVEAASVALAAGASGGFSDMKTTVLITMEESMEAMAKAGKIAKKYKSPAG